MAYLTSGEVEELFNLAHHRLDYWVRSGLVTPTVEADGRGSRRKWGVDAAVRVGLIVSLNRVGGIPIQSIRRDILDEMDTILDMRKLGVRATDGKMSYIDVEAIRWLVGRAFQRRFPQMEQEAELVDEE